MSKEWKGNSKSVSTMLGMTTRWNPEQRAAGDYYTTDPEAVHALCRMTFDETLPQTVWEPACGCGNISKVLEQYGCKVISTDLYDRGYGTPGIDFLQSTKVPDGCRYIITNPPYSLSDQFILHAMDILPDGGEYIALLNLSYLAGKSRFKEIYSKGYLRYIYVFSGRINCYKNNEPTGHSSPVNYGWFVFKKTKPEYRFSPMIFWL